MPYPRAYLWLLALVPLIGLAFWPGYFSTAASPSLAAHIHGVTASLWVLLLIVQSWSIHHRRVGLHRASGRSSLVLFPLFVAGSLLVLHSMAVRSGPGAGPFWHLYGARLGILDALALATFAGLYFAGLRNRHNVQVHARCMVATVILLLMPMLSRLFIHYVPALKISGPEDFGLFAVAVHLSNLTALVVALVLYFRAPEHGRAFAVVAAVAVTQSAGFAWLGPDSWWGSAYQLITPVHPGLLAAAGVIGGAALAAHAWFRPCTRGGPGAARMQDPAAVN